MEFLKLSDTNNMTFAATAIAIVVSWGVLRALYLTWWRPKSLEKLMRKQGLKGTSYRPFSGDLNDIGSSHAQAMSNPITLDHPILPRVLPFVHRAVENYGKMCMIWQGTKLRIIVAETEEVRSVLTNKNGEFVTVPLNPMLYLLHQGTATLSGPKWLHRRKLVAPAFTLDKLKGMMPAFEVSCSEMVNRWKKMVGEEVDVAAEFQRLTGDVISRTAFGNCHENGKKIFELQKQLVVLLVEASRSIYIPGFRFIPTRKNREMYALDAKIRGMLMDMIHKKEEAMRNGKVGGDDLLELLLKSKDESDDGLTLEDVIQECKLFYFAGQETSANLLTWTIVLLSMHPHWQEKARNEVLQVCGHQIPNFQSINHLKIVSMVLNEVLRLYPPAPIAVRHTKQKTNVGGFSVPAGVDLYLPMILLHYDPEYWGEDAKEFKPERFAEGVANASDQMAFYPFGWGPKTCVAQSFALLEAKLALAMILQHFSFRLSPTYAHAPCFGFTLKPQHGAPIILHPI